jgi:catechol 2,3-dioxygenase-like lactoylglutathione lyase family enzyme
VQQQLMLMALLVREYDEAIAWFTTMLGFALLEDTPQTPEKRWVRVAPRGSCESALLLARAATDEQRAYIGKQGGGRVFLFLNTDDFWRDYNDMLSRGVQFTREPKVESYGTVAVFKDLYGNLWDLVQMTVSTRPT